MERQEHADGRFRVVALGRSVVQAPGRAAGFILFWLWVSLLFQGFFPEDLPVAAPFLLNSWALPVLFYALGFLVLGVAYAGWRLVPHGRAWRLALPVAMSGGVALCWLSDGALAGSGLPGTAAYIVGCALFGMGTAALHTEWARLFGAVGTSQTMALGITATLVVGVFTLGLGHAPAVAVRLLLVALPFPMALCLFRDREETPCLHRRGMGVDVRPPWKLLTTAFVQGASLGAMQVLSRGSGLPPAPTILGFALGSALLLACVVLLKPDFNFLIYHVGFPVMACGWLACLVGDQLLGMAAGIHAVGYRFVDLAIWAATIYLINAHDLPTNLVCAMNTCALMAGQFLGSLASSIVGWGDRAALFANALPAVLVAALFGVSLFVYGSGSLKTGWGLVRPVDDAPSGLEAASRALGASAGLTPRECDVLALLARGRNAEYIAEDLTLSAATVRSYIKIVYRKLGVHSQQELISVVERSR